MIQPDDIRTFLRDRPEYNRLLNKEEFTNSQIDNAMKLTVMAFNEISPISIHTLNDFPAQYVLFLGTIYHLLFGGGIGRDRNRLRYQTDGVNVDSEAHSEIELSLSQKMQQDFLNAARMYKTELNMNAGFRTISSEYSSI